MKIKFRTAVKRDSLPESAHCFQGTLTSKWSPWKKGLSPSGLQLWLACKEQFKLRYVDGYRGMVARIGPEFGQCCHHLLEYARKLAAPPDSKWIKAMVMGYEKLWNKEHPGSGGFDKETMETVYGLTEAVMPAYFKRYAGDWKTGKYPPVHKGLDIKGRWVGLEAVFKVPYKYPDGRVMMLNGRRDGVIKSKKELVWILDTKCYSRFNPLELMDLLPFDVQQMMYAWCTAVEMKGQVDGVMLDVIKRPEHRRLKNETLSAFFKRVAAEVGKEKTFEQYFQRMECELRPNDIMRFKKQFLDPCLADFRSWWEGSTEWCGGKTHHYTNPMSLLTKYGKCDYFDLITKGNPMGLTTNGEVDESN